MWRKEVQASLMRGGTSRGVFLLDEKLPAGNRDELFVKLMGSPDPLQVDGLGGGFSSTSKVMLVRKGTKSGADVDYLFGQVYVDKAKVDYSGNCGNLTSAVGPFAVDEGLVKPPRSDTPHDFDVKLFNINTKKHIISTFKVQDGKTHYSGRNDVEGVPETGALVEYRILDPAGTAASSLSSSDAIIEPSLKVDLGAKAVDVSVVDVSSVYAFVPPEAIGISGTELPTMINANENILERAERLRHAIRLKLGSRLLTGEETEDSPSALRLVVVSEMKSYTDWFGRTINVTDADVMVRAFSMGRMHHAVPFTAALCIAAAAKIPGTIVNRVARQTEREEIRIAHPKGIARASAKVKVVRGKPIVEYVKGRRTARLLMRGTAYVEG